MIHYHGTPITPRAELLRLAGRSFCVRYGAAQDLEIAHKIGESVMLDNGAFSFWTTGKETNWENYYSWCEPWLHAWTTWAVIPDVIDGTEEQNEALIKQWPFAQRGAPVWHMHESLDRLKNLCTQWERVCIGSSGLYRNPRSPSWHARMKEAMRFICDSKGYAPTWLHMLRAMHQAANGPYPFASADSTNIARNFKGDNSGRKTKDIVEMAFQVDARQSALVFEQSQ